MCPAIQISDLHFSYDGKRSQFINLNLSIPRGSIYGFLGPNGAGKSTLIRLLVGLLKPSKGSIEVLNKSLRSDKIEILSKIGNLIENPSLYGHLSGAEHMEIAQCYKGNTNPEHINQILKLVGLLDSKHRRVKSYSLGMKQRLGIAIALVCDPTLLILDEPINGLDPKAIKEIRQLLIEINKTYGTTIFISSHVLSEIENTCSHIAIIDEGKILYNGTLKDFKEKQNEQLSFKIQVRDATLAFQNINHLPRSIEILDKNWIRLGLGNQEELHPILQISVEKQLGLTQCILENNLENGYLALIGNAGHSIPPSPG